MGSDFSAIDNFFLYVKDLSDRDYAQSTVNQADNMAKINVWTLFDDKRHDLLESVLNPHDLPHTCALIVLDMDKPWDLNSSF